jgi:orotidine-5'-phosphate decarboxylase
MALVTTRAVPIVVLDYPNATEARRMVEELGELCRFYKVGSELYTAEGPDFVKFLQTRGNSVFLDLKFHDIPNTVRGAVRSAATLGVRLLTVHASGGRSMMEAAVDAAAAAREKCEVLAITILTSLDDETLSSVWDRKVGSMEAEVLRLAAIARDAGVPGVVCSGHEAAAVRQRFGNDFVTLVPGVRLAGGDRQDQARVVTPRQAADAGARYVVIGRTVTAAKSPRDAMEKVLSDLS